MKKGIFSLGILSKKIYTLKRSFEQKTHLKTGSHLSAKHSKYTPMDLIRTKNTISYKTIKLLISLKKCKNVKFK